MGGSEDGDRDLSPENEDRVLVAVGRAGDCYHSIDDEGHAVCGRAGQETREMDRRDAAVFHEPCGFCYGEESSAGGSPHPSISALEEADPDAIP
jgi:hypothetical protein